MKSKHSALEMQQFVGEEKDELLDYLRSLQPEKVSYNTTCNYFQPVEFLVNLHISQFCVIHVANTELWCFLGPFSRLKTVKNYIESSQTN